MTGPVNAPRLQSIVERIEKLEEERKAIGSDIKDVYSEAKGVGYDVKTLRRVIKARAQDPADRAEQESLFETYMHALGHAVEKAVRAVHEGALSLREAAKQAGVSKSTIQRSVPKEGAPENLGTPAPADDKALHDALDEDWKRLQEARRAKGLDRRVSA
jgi:uncharacterized protein (UPF0335 family)